MKIYLTARYARRQELLGYRAQLLALGHTVTSAWLDSDAPYPENGPVAGDPAQVFSPTVPQHRVAAVREQAAIDEFKNVLKSDLLIAFTDPLDAESGRGGSDVELGMALARAMPVIVVGYRRHIFHWLADCQFFTNWDELHTRLKAHKM